MAGTGLVKLFVLLLSVCACYSKEEVLKQKCRVPSSAPQHIEKVINQCQEEIKVAVLSEAAELLRGNNQATINNRAKREAFTEDERRIAGCLLQCVYRKMKAVNTSGFPTIEGLVALYTEGVSDREYFLATLQSVHSCLTTAHKKHITTPQSLEESGKTCDIAFDVFNCVSDGISDFCGQSP